jgi:hypothetical protein
MHCQRVGKREMRASMLERKDVEKYVGGSEMLICCFRERDGA